MTEPTFTLICSGRAVDDRGVPVGDVCGKVFPRREIGAIWAYPPSVDGVVPYVAWMPAEPVSDDAYVNGARSAGWAVGPNREACCPRCRKPSAGVLRDVAAIERSLR